MKKGISVIIPTYNREQFLQEAILSVLDQKFDGDLEVIISDDGSTDQTLQLAESFGDRVKILRKDIHCYSQGVAGTRNRGIKVATQPFICFLDSDDFYLPGHFKKMVPVLEANFDLGFAFCRILEVKTENGKDLFKQWTRKHIFKNDIVNPVVSRSHVAHTNSFMFRKAVFDKVGYFNESYSNGEDGDLWMRISEQFKGEFVDHYGAVYRAQHGINQLTSNSQEKIRKCHLEIHQNALKRYYELGLNDLNRIFELKHLILHGKYRNNKSVYFFKYSSLICRYPLTFFRRIQVSYQGALDKRRMSKWYDLQKFIK